jgi:integrase
VLHAVRWQLIPWNPVTTVDPPSLTSVEVHPFDAKEARLFLGAASGDRFQARWLIAVSLGLRQGRCWGSPGVMLILINAF